MALRSTETADGRAAAQPPTRRPRRVAFILIAAVVLVAASGYFGYVAYEGSRQLVLPDDVSRDCTTPAQMGWEYEAINYDKGDDLRLASENQGHMDSCADQGTAGEEVVARDGTRLAGWYIPAATSADSAAPTVLVTCNRALPCADVVIELRTGPEVVAGSTRLKAGTATKMALNMLTTAAMVRLGKVYGNLMVDVRPNSRKLRARRRANVARQTECG